MTIQSETLASPTPTASADPQPHHEHEHVARATGIVALGNISSRVLGLAREILLSHLFGAGAAVDAFKIAIIVPRGLYDLLIGGHVNSALVPVLSEYADRENRDELWDLVNALLGLVIVVLMGLILGLEILAPQIIRLITSDETSATTIQEATDLLRITAPALFFLSLFAVLSGLLYALKRFTLPTFAATVFNATIVMVTLVFHKHWGITATAVGWFIGALVQFLIQFPHLRDAHIMPRFRGLLQHQGLRTIGILYLPVMFSLGLDVLINRPFSYKLASSTGEGNISYMDWATTLIQFPHGLVATAISIAVLPTLSQQAARSISHGLQDFKNTLGLGLRLSTVMILPATIGLFVLALPVVALIFQHGEFTASDSITTAHALRLYLIGLPFAAIDLLLVFAFYAQQDTLTPAIIGVVSLVAYMLTAILLLPKYGFLSLMIADSVKHGVHTSISGWLLWRRVGGLHGQHLVSTVARAGFASTVMGLLTLATLLTLEQALPDSNPIAELVYVVGAGGVGMVTYLAVGKIIGLTELAWITQIIRRKLQR